MVNLWTIAEYHVKLWLIWKKFMTISQLLTCMPPLVAPNLITMTQWIFRHQFLSLVSKVPLCHVNLGGFFKDTDIFILGGKKYALDFGIFFWMISSSTVYLQIPKWASNSTIVYPECNESNLGHNVYCGMML